MLDTVIKSGTIYDGLGGAPFIGDIGLKDGKIAEVASAITTPAKDTLYANGAIITPGFVDVHTHYDGQVSWDDEMDPSASHGVTTVVMGNCGVGFAPVPPGGEGELISVMEGVEDIPGTALYEGIEWGKWETFPEYLDYIDSRRYALDVSAQIPHAAVRNYVMGERGRNNDAATPDDIQKMAQIVKEGVDAGAVGFTTSRTIGHRCAEGKSIPGTFAADDEIYALGDALGETGKGVFELIPGGAIGELAHLGGEMWTTEHEITLMATVSRKAKRPVTFTMVQHGEDVTAWRDILEQVAAENAKGAQLFPQVASRPIGLVTSLKTYHMFQYRPTYVALQDKPFETILAEMQKPEVRAAMLAEEDLPPTGTGMMAGVPAILKMAGIRLFEISNPIDYEPTEDQSFVKLAETAGVTYEEYMYDFLVKDGGGGFAIMLGGNYADANHDAIFEMLSDPNTVTGLSDAGAHVTLIFDGVAPTYQMTHWSRDRTRGERLPLEFVVHKQTKKNADLYGFSDRGSIEVGKRADLNVIDFDKLELGQIEVRDDLPAGGKRILQPAKGYIATYVNGVKTRENDRDTGARPGRLVRSS